MNEPVKFQPVTIETVDQAVFDWFDKTVDVHVDGANGLQKVPMNFTQGERWNAGRVKQAFRDENGVLILPIIALRRTGIDPELTRTSLGIQTDYIQIAKRVDPKTNEIQNLEKGKLPPYRRDYPPIYDVYTVPYPERVSANYQLVIQTQYITQMNQALEKIWRSLDIQQSFVAPLHNDGRKPPRQSQFGNIDPYDKTRPLDYPFVVGFFESPAGDSGNFEEFTDVERIVKYTLDVTVPFVLQTSPSETTPPVQVQRTAYKVVLKDENVVFVDDPNELDEIFGKAR